MSEFEKRIEQLRIKRQSSPLFAVPLMGAEARPGGEEGEQTPGVEEEEEKEETGTQPTVEQATKPTTGRDPRCPTEQERAEHELTHLPFRIWCRACVEGRLDNHAHPTLQRDHDVPTVLMDYAFVSRTHDEKSLTLLIMKDRDSRALQADVALHKGRGEEEVIEQAADNVRHLGHETNHQNRQRASTYLTT